MSAIGSEFEGWSEEVGAAQSLRGRPGIEPDLRIFRKTAPDGTILTVFVGTIPLHGLHLSISGQRMDRGRLVPSRYPSWDEIRDARYLFIQGDVEMVMHLPPKSQYLNVHDTCFHLHQLFSNRPPRDPTAPPPKDLKR